MSHDQGAFGRLQQEVVRFGPRCGVREHPLGYAIDLGRSPRHRAAWIDQCLMMFP